MAAIAALLVPAASYAACLEPAPPRSCTELTLSDLVVVGMVGAEERTPGTGESDPGRITYRVQVERALKGEAPKEITISSENASGRFQLEANRRALLFLQRNADGTYGGNPCGRSGALVKRQDTLRAIETTLSQRLKQASVGGHVFTDQKRDVLITARDGATSYRTRIDANGQFVLSVAPGTYVVEASRDGTRIRPFELSLQSPDKLRLDAGNCADVAFDARGE